MTETVGFTVVALTKEQRVKQAFGKAMKKYPLQGPPGGGGPSGGGPPGGGPSSGGPPGGGLSGGGPPGGGPSGGGPPGGGPPGGGGGSPGGAPPALPAPAPNADVRPIGSPPSIYHGDRALANNFLDELNLYFQVNWAVPNYQSMITRAAFTLTYIKGEEVAGWVRDFGEFLRNLNPAIDDGPVIWEHFVNSFREQFQDSMKEN